MDGHGEEGHIVSSYVKKRLPKQIARTYRKQDNSKGDNSEGVFQEAFAQTNQELLNEVGINTIMSGCTCVVVLIVDMVVYCANVGDSRAILCSIEDENLQKWRITPLSRDQKPCREDERKRIQMAGGVVAKMRNENNMEVGPLRVWQSNMKMPGLAMTRSMGDGAGIEAGVICTPEISKISLNQHNKIIIIASDGVWEYLENDDVLKIVIPYYQRRDHKGAASALVKEAQKSWTNRLSQNIDDITCVIIFLDIDKK